MKKIATVVFLLSVLFTIGSAGALERDMVGLLQGVLQMLAGTAVSGVCVLVLRLMERNEVKGNA